MCFRKIKQNLIMFITRNTTLYIYMYIYNIFWSLNAWKWQKTWSYPWRVTEKGWYLGLSKLNERLLHPCKLFLITCYAMLTYINTVRYAQSITLQIWYVLNPEVIAFCLLFQIFTSDSFWGFEIQFTEATLKMFSNSIEFKLIQLVRLLSNLHEFQFNKLQIFWIPCHIQNSTSHDIYIYKYNSEKIRRFGLSRIEKRYEFYTILHSEKPSSLR